MKLSFLIFGILTIMQILHILLIYWSLTKLSIEEVYNIRGESKYNVLYNEMLIGAIYATISIAIRFIN